MLRFPGSNEFFWNLHVDDEVKRFDFSSPLESDDGDVLTNWARTGNGIVNKPIFEVTNHLESGALIKVAANNPPTDQSFSCVYPHKRLQDPKVRLFIEFMVKECKEQLL